MRVLVACERSGVVRDAFAARGHNAWSCDLQAAEGKHIQGDALVALRDGWDLVVAPTLHLLDRDGQSLVSSRVCNAIS